MQGWAIHMVIFVACSLFWFSAHGVETGMVTFRADKDQSKIPERYRLETHTFLYEIEKKYALPNIGVEVFRVRFPSPVESPHAENNTVHAEYYRPEGDGPFPCT